jgi:TIR domain
MFEWLWGAEGRPSEPTSLPSRQARPPKIYISYRRQDSAGFAGRISDRLSASFGSQNVFVDIDTIAPGADFAASITEEVRLADVFLVLIGPNWANARTADGARRIEDPDDFVRREVESAIGLKKPVIPVLLGGERIPDPQQVPVSLRQITLVNAISVAHATFHHDIDLLIAGIRSIIETKASELEPGHDEQTSVFVSHSSSDRNWVEREIRRISAAKPHKALVLRAFYIVGGAMGARSTQGNASLRMVLAGYLPFCSSIRLG